jgi:hypothetical protein
LISTSITVISLISSAGANIRLAIRRSYEKKKGCTNPLMMMSNLHKKTPKMVNATSLPPTHDL